MPVVIFTFYANEKIVFLHKSIVVGGAVKRKVFIFFVIKKNGIAVLQRLRNGYLHISSLIISWSLKWYFVLPMIW